VLQGREFYFFFLFFFWLYARLGKNLISDRDAPNRGQGEISSRVSLSKRSDNILFYLGDENQSKRIIRASSLEKRTRQPQSMVLSKVDKGK
jgi:hypothetical protein